MCGRYTETHELADLAERFGFSAPDTEHSPRFNIAPGQFAPVVVCVDGVRELKLMRWGLVPFWAKDEKIAYKTINARSETLAERASFKHALKLRRCLVLADGFYEWQKTQGGKTPHYIYLKGNPAFSFAGLWEKWDKAADGETLYTFSIITTRPNSFMEQLHNRMPVILKPGDEAAWLAADTCVDGLQRLYEPYSENEMQSHYVDKAVGNVNNQGPKLIEPTGLQL